MSTFTVGCLEEPPSKLKLQDVTSVAWHISYVLDISVVFSSRPAMLSWDTPAFFAQLRSPLELTGTLTSVSTGVSSGRVTAFDDNTSTRLFTRARCSSFAGPFGIFFTISMSFSIVAISSKIVDDTTV